MRAELINALYENKIAVLHKLTGKRIMSINAGKLENYDDLPSYLDLEKRIISDDKPNNVIQAKRSIWSRIWAKIFRR